MRIQRYKNIDEATYYQNWPFLGTLSLEEGAYIYNDWSTGRYVQYVYVYI
jgi:hypothetical protein